MQTDNNEILSDEILDKGFLNTIEDALAIGSWELNMLSNTLKWSSVTKKIHDVVANYVPNVDTAINFYKKGQHREKILDLFQKALQKGENFDDEFIIITSKGEEKWVRSIGHPKFKNGVCVALRGVFQDITQKTLQSKKTLIKEKEFRSLFDYSLTGMAKVSLTGGWLKVNNSICRILGYTESELLKLSFKDITYKEDLTIGNKELTLLLSGKSDNFTVNKRYLHKNGKVLYCNLSATIVRDDHGHPQHFIANINDISEIELSKNKISDLLSISSKQNDRLLNFARIVSHNLSSHGGNLEMLLTLKKEDYPENTKDEYFPLMQEAIGNLNETIENLNEVALYSALDKEALVPLNLLKYSNNAMSNITAATISNNVDVKILIDNNITVNAIPAYLDSILINFLTNAIKYRRQNVNPEITLKAYKTEVYTILKISDNGQGIDLDKHKDKLFGMYNVFHKHKDSRGLGLFIVKNQIDAIGGKIEVESIVDQGTTFTLYFKN
ncbi:MULTISPECIES: sensor histidine kinase [unclassified Olleya]|jgi:PAS domain S-box-containing protein|uniref:sensor histidine kinase n=1 Tax=unclassified Olleya TaxID=2615019 RepID=UPI0011A6FDA4|nr:PAS domain-containing sensor histidine kinase [Olleya sp. Hel_I_94]TVZ47210.1 PAS domain S-box-containing protein [Olleya sp. Hel_I_94]